MKLNHLDILRSIIGRVCASIVMAVLLFSTICFSQTSKWENQSFSNVVNKLFWEYDVPSGLSIAFEKTGEKEILINFNPNTNEINDLLNDLIKSDSRYVWKNYDGVYNVFPQEDYEILDVKISDFKSENLPLSELEKQIIDIPEFKKYLEENNLVDKIPDAEKKYGFLCCGFVGRENSRNKFSINLQNPTIREILNEIVRIRGFGAWVYREYEIQDGGKTYRIFRLTL